MTMTTKQEVGSLRVSDFLNRWEVLRLRLHSTLAILLFATIVAYAPVLLDGYPPNSWDSRYHAITARLFSNQLWSGDLYPRWLMGMNSGLGSPHFFFYPPLGFYVASLFSWLGGPTAMPQLGAAAALLGFISGVACYLWLVRIMPQAAALTAAVFYLASPFHLFVDLLMRGDIAEFTAMTFTPICLLGVELFRERKWYGLLVIGLGFAAVTLSHIVVGLLFSGVPSIYFLARSGWRTGWAMNTLLVLVACGLGLGCSGLYLVPALAYRSDVYVPIHELAPASFIFGGPAQPHLILFVRLLFFCYAALLLAAGAWWWRLRAKDTLDGNLVITCLCLGLATLALMTVWARPLWLMVPITAAVQFSYRMFVIVDLCIAGLIGSFVASLATRPRLPVIVFVARLIFLGAALAGAAEAAHFGVFDYNALLWRERVRYADDYGLFRPKAVHDSLPADALPLYDGGSFGPDIPLPPHVKVEQGDAQVRVLSWEPRRIDLSVRAESVGELVVGQLYFPGWEAIDATSGKRLPVAPSSGQGLVTIPFPKGSLRLRVVMVPRLPEYEGAAISLLSLAVLVALALGSKRARSNA